MSSRQMSFASVLLAVLMAASSLGFVSPAGAAGGAAGGSGAAVESSFGTANKYPRWCRKATRKYLRHVNAREWRQVRAMTFEGYSIAELRSARRDGVRFLTNQVGCDHADDMPDGYTSYADAEQDGKSYPYAVAMHADGMDGNPRNWKMWDIRVFPANVRTQATETRAERWHRLDIECRGGAGDDPATLEACAKRDRLTAKVGREFVGRFHAAFKRSDQPTMRRMVDPSNRSNTMAMLQGRASRTARECDYGNAAHYCYFRKTTGGWVGVQFKVVRIEADRLPIWKATGAAPDGV